MNLLDRIHECLTCCGPATSEDIATTLIDPKLISPSKVTEDLHRLKQLGRVTLAKSGEWSAA